MALRIAAVAYIVCFAAYFVMLVISLIGMIWECRRIDRDIREWCDRERAERDAIPWEEPEQS